MNEETDPSPRYLNGFNHGYELQRHSPGLLEKLLAGSKDDRNDYFKGMTEGGKQQSKEEAVERMQQRGREQQKSNGPER